MKKISIFICFLIFSVILPTWTFANKPNIIFILTDDLGFGDVGILFQKQRKGVQLETPELDQMAMNGTTLNRHYCPAPICAPSRASLISGMHQGHSNAPAFHASRHTSSQHPAMEHTLRITFGYLYTSPTHCLYCGSAFTAHPAVVAIPIPADIPPPRPQPL